MAARKSTSSSSAGSRFTPTPDMRIIVLHGKEPFLLAEHTRELVEMLAEVHGDVEQFNYDGASAALADVLDELRSYGLMQPHKLVVLDKADEFLAGEDRTVRSAIERYAQHPVDHSTLLMRTDNWRKSNLDKLIAKVGVVHKVKDVTPVTAIGWCTKRVEKRHDATMDEDAAALLVERVGTNMGRINAELNKLAAGVAPGGRITRDDVVAVVGVSREEKAWEIQSAVASGRPREALEKLHELIHISRQPEELIVWSLTDLARKLHAASQMLARGEAPGTVSQVLRLWGAAQRPILDTAKRLGPAKCAELLDAAVRTSWANRQTGANEARNIEVLTARMADTMRRR